MNRSILIVICDFLLVSLLAFSTVDATKLTNPSGARTMAGMADTAPANRIGGREDLGDVMRLALEDEHKQQEALAAELSKTRTISSQQQSLLTQRDQQLQAFQQKLSSQEDQAARLQEQQTNLLRQMNLARSDIENLNHQLQATTAENELTKEQRDAQEAENSKHLAEAAALRQQLAALDKTNQLLAAQREQLNNQLQLTETEKQAATAQLAEAEENLDVQREQNSRLAEGVNALAGKSSELATEIRQSRPRAPNEIFSEFATNRVEVSFSGMRPGFFGGEISKDKETESILASDGTNTFVLCHLQETLLTLWDPGTSWEELSGTLSRGSVVRPINSLSFYLPDPRIALLPVPDAWARQFGCTVYRLSADPYKFQDAVVIGARGGYYGECQFQIDLTTPQYLKMDRNSLKGLFGKFNPSTGDLVFSKTGDLLGVMANNTYCIVIRNFEAAATFRFGNDVRGQPIAETLASLYSTVAGLPFKLQ